MFDSSYHDMDLKFLLFNDSVKGILEVAKVERPFNDTIKGNSAIKGIKFQKRKFSEDERPKGVGSNFQGTGRPPYREKKRGGMFL
uniref:Uncharacterized protein n=1 Tax=Lepeophtheirus salmonis TaxID=72036 RepID=A0A0K2URB7_LEPSM